MSSLVPASEELFHQPIFHRFCQFPFEFVDIGSLGGVHPLIKPISFLTHVLCFETDQSKLVQVLAEREHFAALDGCPLALFDRPSVQPLFLTEAVTNISLLEPNPDFVARYQANKFQVLNRTEIEVHSFDQVIAERFGWDAFGELWKLDTQGSEYEILQGAEHSISTRALGVFCEVEFMEVYKNQKHFSHIEMFLREFGLNFYFLSPNFRSTKRLNQSPFASRERFMWADALFLKDPLDSNNRSRAFSDRQIEALIMIALVFRFYDVALEWLYHYREPHADREALDRLIQQAALDFRQEINLSSEQRLAYFNFEGK